MKLFLVLILAGVGIAYASDVLVFDNDNFATEIQNHDFILVNFFSPWCGACKKLSPSYEKAATLLKKEDPPIPIAKVDCTVNHDLCKEYEIEAFPTLKIFKSGTFSDVYMGPRDEKSLAASMIRKTVRQSKYLPTVDSFNKFLKNDYVLIIAFYDEKSPELKFFKKVAKASSKEYLRFAHVTSQEVTAVVGVPRTVKLYRAKRMDSPYEEQSVSFDKPLNISSLKGFIHDNWFGLCGHITRDVFRTIKRPLVVVFSEKKLDFVKKPVKSNYWRFRIMEVALDFADRMNFGIATLREIEPLLPDEGLPERETSSVNPRPLVIIVAEDDKQYIMPELFSKEKFREFLNNYFAGKIKPYIRSDPIPKSNNGPLVKLVGYTFEEVVWDENQQVLILFDGYYDPQSKPREEKLRKVAQKFKRFDDVMIATIDAGTNYFPAVFDVESLPTVYWVAKKDKTNLIKYKGKIEVGELVHFVIENASDNWRFKTEL